MRFLGAIFRSHWTRTLLGVLLLALLIWVFGPLIGFGEAHPFDSEIVRALAIAALLALWVIVNLMTMLKARKREKDLIDNVAASTPDPSIAASAEEVALLGERLREALDRLKKLPGSRWGRRRLYQLPWYMFIGPPGAGKTTALVNSGLKFPLADAAGPAALKGVGGTRNCDWWFTDQAVLIDTAGRYTTQDSQAAVDSAAWLGFLKLLKKHRRRQPLNGVLLAIGLSDLAGLDEGERLGHAQAMRRRLRELQDELGVRMPVYVLFTKSDLTPGFVEFFDNLGKEEREQVWGMTLPLDEGKDEAGAVAKVGAEFDALLARLNDRMLERVHQETDIQRRRLIYGFPQQLAATRELAIDFLTEIFRPSRLEARPLLRGVYFTSGTQDGTPIDRLLGAMAGRFGLKRQAIPAFSGAGRSYFLTRLMREVVFGEAGLVSTDPKVERRVRWTYRTAYGIAATVLILATAGWARSYIGNRVMIDEVHGSAEKYNAQFAELTKRGPGDTDLRAILPPLDTLRNIRGGYAQREASTPIELTFGLYQGDKLTEASIQAYYRALDALLLPRLLARLETQLRANLDKPDFLYEALKVYLVLGRQGPIDHDQVMAWLITDFSASMPPANPGDPTPERDALLDHADAMLRRPLAAVPLDGPLVAQVRDILNREPLAEYSYNRIMRSPRIQSLADWTVADNAGPGAGKVFQLRSGKPITTGLPGIFTWSGYHTVFLPLLPLVTKDLAEDSWVLGRQDHAGVAGQLAEVTRLRHDVIGLYLDEYVRRWDRMLADIALKTYPTPAESADELEVIAAPSSPLRNLLTSIDGQTQLSHAAASDAAEQKLEGQAAKIGQRAAGFGKYLAGSSMTTTEAQITSILGESFGTTPGTTTPIDPATRVDEHFRPIHLFVSGTKDKPAPLEGVIQKINTLSQGLGQVANAPAGSAVPGLAGGGAAASAGAAAQGLKDAAKEAPPLIGAMLQAVGDKSNDQIAKGAGDELRKAWASDVLPYCQAALSRYPIVAGSAQDVPPDDFARLLGPGGKIDAFFNDKLKSFVDVNSKPWRWQTVNQARLGLSNDSLAQFERAALIRDALFAPTGGGLQVRFSLTPVSLDAGIGKVSVEIGGQTLTYDHGPIESAQFQWPGANGKTLVRTTLTPASGGGTNAGTGSGGAGEGGIEKDGPWALLRFLDAAQVIPSGQADKFRLVLKSAAGGATFDLGASSVRNPFTLSALRQFRCPASL